MPCLQRGKRLNRFESSLVMLVYSFYAESQRLMIYDDIPVENTINIVSCNRRQSTLLIILNTFNLSTNESLPEHLIIYPPSLFIVIKR